MISVVLADDQELVREGLRVLLDRTEDVRVVGVADSADSALRTVAAERPDVVLMDIRMPGDGIAATRRITADRALAGVGVIVLTTFDTDENLHEAIRAGAAGFLLKDAAPDELRRAVRVVAGGDALLSPAVTRRVLAAAAARPGPLAAYRLAGLTPREREVLAQVGAGRSNDEIAGALHMSSATARTHVGRLLSKLHARDRAQLVVLAYETGLVTPGAAGA